MVAFWDTLNPDYFFRGKILEFGGGKQVSFFLSCSAHIVDIVGWFTLPIGFEVEQILAGEEGGGIV